MASISGFGERTAASAREAARLYFRPLYSLGGLFRSVPGKWDFPGSFHPLRVVPTAHWQHDLSSWHSRLGRVEDPMRLVSEAQAAHVWSENVLHDVDQLVWSSEVEYKECLARWYASDLGSQPLARLYHQTAISKWFSLAGWVLTLMDGVVVSFLLFTLFEFPILSAIGVALLLVMTLVAATTGLSSLIVIEFEIRPQTANRRLLPKIAALGLSIAALVGVLAFVRAGGATSALIPYILTTIAILIPALVALMQSGSLLYGWSDELTNRWLELIELRAEIQSLRQEASGILERGHTETNQVQEASPNRPTRAISIAEDV